MPLGEEKQQALFSYFKGSDPEDWQAGCPTYARVVYEDLVACPAKTVREIGCFAGFELPDWEPEEPELKKQATDLNRIFRERYLEKICADLNIPNQGT